ncbi:MAG: CGNR zinc finger domain-containing protein [Pseudomonas sp.]
MNTHPKWPEKLLIANHPALDFLNTVDRTKATDNELLTSYSSVLDLAWAAHQINENEHAELTRLAVENQSGAGQALRDLLRWREETYRVCAAISQRAIPAYADWMSIQSAVQQAISKAYLTRTDLGRACWEIDAKKAGLSTVYQRLTLRLHVLLISDLVCKLKQCDGCTWMFIDTSKNLRRRWCSTSTCGRRAKSLSPFADGSYNVKGG